MYFIKRHIEFKISFQVCCTIWYSFYLKLNFKLKIRPKNVYFRKPERNSENLEEFSKKLMATL